MAPIRVTRLPAAMVTPAALLRLTLTVPVEVKSESNTRSHWADRYRRFKRQAAAIDAALWPIRAIPQGFGHMVAFGWKVTVGLTKLGGRPLDSDNLAGSMKAVRDCLAKWLGVDDGDPRLTWKYEQEPGKLVGVRVTVESSEG